MRFLIVASVLACAAAVPSGLLAAPFAHGYAAHGLAAHGYAAHGLAAHGYAAHGLGAHGLAAHGLAVHAPLAVAHAAPALPTISPGDLAGAAIEAHVDASDHVRAAVDATRELHDQAAEQHGQAINAAEDHSWQAVDAVKTAEAQLDGAAAGVAPVLAKQLAGHAAYAAPLAHAAYAAPLAHAAYAAPVAHAAYAAPLAHAAYAAPIAHAAYAAPVAHAASQTVVSQSLHQSHPAPLVHAAPLLAHAAPVAYATHAGLGHAYGHGLAHW